MRITIVRKVVEVVDISEEMYHDLTMRPTNEQEHIKWLEAGEKFAQPYGGWSYGKSIENGVMAVYLGDWCAGEFVGQIIAEA